MKYQRDKLVDELARSEEVSRSEVERTLDELIQSGLVEERGEYVDMGDVDLMGVVWS